MAKVKILYVCQECGTPHPKWEGQCRGCQKWNTLVEETQSAPQKEGARGWSVREKQGLASKVVRLNETITETEVARYPTGYTELDRVLGGGLVKGSYTLLGGDPGIGKSTLLLQMAGGLAKSQVNILYVSGEESVSQSALRAQRLGIRDAHVHMAAESQLEGVFALVEKVKPQILVVDSIQTIYMAELTSAPGSVSQVRECASRLMSLAKSENICVLLIGHVTKDGNIAGPKVLEHMVDTVLSFEGDTNHQYRLLRTLKNRFGASHELGVFEMNSGGLEEVTNPSELFLEERGSHALGSAVYPAMEGSRPLLCEIQALSVSSPLPMPRRTSLGFDTHRVHLLIAVLSKHLNIDLFKSDIFVNIVGGLKISEPAADLAVTSAIISSAYHKELQAKACFFGEIGLTGEVRGASFCVERVKEAQKLGFEYFVLPFSNKKHLEKNKELALLKNTKIIYIKNIQELANVIKNLNPRSNHKGEETPTKSINSFEI